MCGYVHVCVYIRFSATRELAPRHLRHLAQTRISLCPVCMCMCMCGYIHMRVCVCVCLCVQDFAPLVNWLHVICTIWPKPEYLYVMCGCAFVHVCMYVRMCTHTHTHALVSLCVCLLHVDLSTQGRLGDRSTWMLQFERLSDLCMYTHVCAISMLRIRPGTQVRRGDRFV
jgi:hypothetical protein